MVTQTFLEFLAAQAPDGGAFDLAHAFARKPHRLAHFLQRMVVVRADAVTKTQHLSFAGLQFGQAVLNFTFHRSLEEAHLRIVRFFPLHKVDAARIFVVADRRINRFHPAHGLDENLHLRQRHLGEFGQFRI